VYVAVASSDGDAAAVGRGLVQTLAEGLVERPRLMHDEFGRPSVDGLWVSVSHSGRRTAVAVGGAGPLGIDLEEREPREFRAVADRWFSQRELQWLAAQPDQLDGFLRLWTAKEAVGKALGEGLGDGLLRREMPLIGGPVPGATGLAVTYLPCPDGILALAAPENVTVEPVPQSVTGA
jgi:phosphopantetheinyl transferase